MRACICMTAAPAISIFIIVVAFHAGILLFPLREPLSAIAAYLAINVNAGYFMLPIAARIGKRILVPILPIIVYICVQMLAAVYMPALSAYTIFIIIMAFFLGMLFFLLRKPLTAIIAIRVPDHNAECFMFTIAADITKLALVPILPIPVFVRICVLASVLMFAPSAHVIFVILMAVHLRSGASMFLNDYASAAIRTMQIGVILTRHFMLRIVNSLIVDLFPIETPGFKCIFMLARILMSAIDALVVRIVFVRCLRIQAFTCLQTFLAQPLPTIYAVGIGIVCACLDVILPFIYILITVILPPPGFSLVFMRACICMTAAPAISIFIIVVAFHAGILLFPLREPLSAIAAYLAINVNAGYFMLPIAARIGKRILVPILPIVASICIQMLTGVFMTAIDAFPIHAIFMRRLRIQAFTCLQVFLAQPFPAILAVGIGIVCACLDVILPFIHILITVVLPPPGFSLVFMRACICMTAAPAISIFIIVVAFHAGILLFPLREPLSAIAAYLAINVNAGYFMLPIAARIGKRILVPILPIVASICIQMLTGVFMTAIDTLAI